MVAALLQTFMLPTAELRSASPHSGPSRNLLRHRFAITCIFRAPPPALSGGGYVRLMAAQKLCGRSAVLSFRVTEDSLCHFERPKSPSVIMRGCASLCHFERSTKCGAEKSFLRALRLVEMTKGHSLSRDDIGCWWWEGESMVPRGEFGCDG